MDALRLEAGALGEPPENQEGACPRERPTAGVEEQLGAVPAVEKGPALGQIAAEGIGAAPPNRDDPLLRALADAANEPRIEIDAALFERDGLGYAQA